MIKGLKYGKGLKNPTQQQQKTPKHKKKAILNAREAILRPRL